MNDYELEVAPSMEGLENVEADESSNNLEPVLGSILIKSFIFIIRIPSS